MTAAARIGAVRIGGRPLSAWRYAIRFRVQHIGRAIAYARGTMTPAQALWILGDCEEVAGHYALESVSVDSVLEDARARWADRPELVELATRAAARTAENWTGGETTAAAIDSALDLLADYAAQDGIELVELDAAENEARA